MSSRLRNLRSENPLGTRVPVRRTELLERPAGNPGNDFESTSGTYLEPGFPFLEKSLLEKSAANPGNDFVGPPGTRREPGFPSV